MNNIKDFSRQRPIMRTIYIVISVCTISLMVLLFIVIKDNDQEKKTKETNKVSYQDITNKLISDPSLSRYLTFAKIKRTKDAALPNFYGRLRASFDHLSEKKQYEFFRRAQNVASKIYSEENINSNKIICVEDNGCIIDEFYLKTPDHTYNMDYDYNDPQTNYLSIDNNKVVYSPSLGLINNSKNSSKDNNEGTKVPSADNTSFPDTNIYTADGDDWIQLNSTQKMTMIEKEISIVESTGGVVMEEPQWFIDALNAYYGDPATNPTKITEIFNLSGKAGGVLILGE